MINALEQVGGNLIKELGTLKTLFISGWIVAALWIGRVLTTFIMHWPKRIKLIADLVLGMIVGAIAGAHWWVDPAAGASWAVFVFGICLAFVAYLSQDTRKPWQKAAAKYLTGDF